MSNTWIQWEGQIVNGKFQLLRFLGGSENSAVFLTQRQENDRVVNAAIRLVPCTPEGGTLQLSRWRTFAELSHPNLIPLYDMGRSEVGDVPFVYLVMECADENLSQVVPGRALAADEAREIVGSVLGVLSYLHGKGFVHGGIKLAEIMAAADQLKLSSDDLHRDGETLRRPGDRDAYVAPEISSKSFPLSQPLSPASDVWALGMTLIESLTQTLPAVRAIDRQDPFIPMTMPEPFLDIAKHCLIRNPQGRWTVDQIAARLEGRVPAPPAVKPSASTEALPTNVSAAPALPPVRRSRPPAKPNRYVLPFAVGFAVVVAALLVGPKLLHRHPEAPQASPKRVPARTSSRPQRWPQPNPLLNLCAAGRIAETNLLRWRDEREGPGSGAGLDSPRGDARICDRYCRKSAGRAVDSRRSHSSRHAGGDPVGEKQHSRHGEGQRKGECGSRRKCRRRGTGVPRTESLLCAKRGGSREAVEVQAADG